MGRSPHAAKSSSIPVTCREPWIDPWSDERLCDSIGRPPPDRSWIEFEDRVIVSGQNAFTSFVTRHHGHLTAGLLLVSFFAIIGWKAVIGFLLCALVVVAVIVALETIWRVRANRPNMTAKERQRLARAQEHARLIHDCECQNAALAAGDVDWGMYGRFPPPWSKHSPGVYAKRIAEGRCPGCGNELVGEPVPVKSGHVHDGFHCAPGCMS